MNWFPHEISWTAWIWPVVLSAVALWLWQVTVRMAPDVKIALLVFNGFYILTTLLGGIVIGVTEGEVLQQLGYGLDLAPLVDVGSATYWCMLFAPLVLPLLVFMLLRDVRVVDELLLQVIPHGETSIKTTGFLSMFGLFAAYCFARLAWSGNLLAITTWHSAQSDYHGMIAVRYELHEQLGSAFFGIVYIALPTLSYVALHQAVQTKQVVWKVLTMLSIGTVCFISLSLMQKSPLLIYFVFLNLALLDLKVVSLKTFALFGASALVLLTVLQSFMLESWDFQNSIDLVLFRMAASFPYYLSIYPELAPFSGVETGLHLVGLGTVSTDNHLVFNYMYPEVKIQGAVTAPAHLRAYCQAGYLYALITLGLVAIPLRAAEMAHAHSRSPLAFAAYMGLLIQLYYVMQTSLRESLLSCYGLFWVVVAVGVTLVVSFRPRPTNVQQPRRPSIAPAPVPYRAAAR